MIVLSIIIAFGLALGKLRVKGVSLGVTFVFFAGIFAGHLGLSIDPVILHYTENLGLVLFVYELGLKVGPGFFSSFRKGGLELNLLGLGVIFIGTVMTVLISLLFGIPIGDAVGVMCGATTNTPPSEPRSRLWPSLESPPTGRPLVAPSRIHWALSGSFLQ